MRRIIERATVTRAALKHAARMRAINIGTFRRRVAAIKGWRRRRARMIRQREEWCLEQLRQRGMI